MFPQDQSTARAYPGSDTVGLHLPIPPVLAGFPLRSPGLTPIDLRSLAVLRSIILLVRRML